MKILSTLAIALLVLGVTLYVAAHRPLPAVVPSSDAAGGGSTAGESRAPAADQRPEASHALVAGEPETLTLTEVLFGADNTPNAAVIARNGGAAKVYRAGESIDGTGGVTVTELFTDRIIVNRDGINEMLVLPGADEGLYVIKEARPGAPPSTAEPIAVLTVPPTPSQPRSSADSTSSSVVVITAPDELGQGSRPPIDQARGDGAVVIVGQPEQ